MRWQGEDFLVVGHKADGGFAFWIERPPAPGRVWQYISEEPPPDHLGIKAPEFVAATEGGSDELVEGIARESGWFEPTGKVVEHPRNRQNEVWRVAPECPLVTPSPQPQAVAESQSTPAEQPSAEAPQGDGGAPDNATSKERLAALLAQWAAHMTQVAGLSGVVVTAPDPFSDEPQSRVFAAVHPPHLTDMFAAAHLPIERPEEANVSHGLVQECQRLAPLGLASHGFRSWVSMRVPSGNSCYEVLLLGGSPVDRATAGLAFCDSQRYLTPMKRLAADTLVHLTPRQRDCLFFCLLGESKKVIAEKLGLADRTVAAHHGNGCTALRARTTVHAAFRAQRIGHF